MPLLIIKEQTHFIYSFTHTLLMEPSPVADARKALRVILAVMRAALVSSCMLNGPLSTCVGAHTQLIESYRSCV